MNKIVSKTNYTLIFGVPLCIIIVLIGVVNSSVFSTHSAIMAIGVTFDLLLTMPLAYFLLIRKTTIPKTTVVPFLIVGLAVGLIVLPAKHHYYLEFFKTWLLPIVEVFLLVHIIYKVRKAIKQFKEQKQITIDFYTTLQLVCNASFSKLPAMFLVNEIAIFYYGLIYWKKRELEANEFSYHKGSGTPMLLIAFILILGIETFVLHVLVEKWSIVAAWVLTSISVYSGFQIIGLLKSLMKRPIYIDNGRLYLRYGILSEATIALNTIKSVELSTKDIDKEKVRKLSPLGDLESHNLIITLKKEATLHGLFGAKKQFTVLALYVDDKQCLKNKIESRITIKS